MSSRRSNKNKKKGGAEKEAGKTLEKGKSREKQKEKDKRHKQGSKVFCMWKDSERVWHPVHWPLIL